MDQGRTRQERKADTLKLLEHEVHIWLATATDDQHAHLIPLTFYWDGQQLTLAMVEPQQTADNLRRTGWARGALGSTRDVVIVEGPVTFTPVDEIDPTIGDALRARWTAPIDFRTLPGFVFVHLHPQRIQAYRPGYVERTDRTLMRHGRWLV
jgi:hypothetical protein